MEAKTNLWTAAEREADWKDVNLTGNPAMARVIEKADRTVAALMEALEVMTSNSENATRDVSATENARALLEGLKG